MTKPKRKSPDCVADLDVAVAADATQREEELDDVRKRLKQSSPAAASARTSSTTSISSTAPTVTGDTSSKNDGRDASTAISLLEDSDDEEFEAFLKNNGPSPFAVAAEKKAEEKKKATLSTTTTLVKTEGVKQAILSVEDDDGGGKIGSVASLLASGFYNDGDDDDIQVVPPVLPTVHPDPATAAAAAAASSSSASDDIVVVGTANETRLPHMRQHCTVHPFSGSYVNRTNSATNEKFCDLCYCYVCDKPASECKNWVDSNLSYAAQCNHCCASDVGPTYNGQLWVQMRNQAKTKAASAASASDDIVVVGTANETRLPHMRQHCTVHPFIGSNPDVIANCAMNKQFCDLCYCYVCDKPASECTNWLYTMRTLGSNQVGYNHCCASNVGPPYDGQLWVRMRNQVKAKAASSAATSATNIRLGNIRVTGRGPFEPEHSLADKDPNLTKCRKCGWYSRLEVDSYNFNNDRRGGCRDWCHSCGRVASNEAFERNVQAEQFKRRPTDIYLGEKILTFRIVAHDPRKFDDFKVRWTQYGESDPRWKYTEAEMEEDVFKQRLGKRPRINMILASLPIVADDKIPTTGAVRYESGSSYYNRVSASETDAIILEKRDDRILFDELSNFESIGCSMESAMSSPLQGEIIAEWNREARKGIFKVRVYLQNDAFSPKKWSQHGTDCHFSKVLRPWFDISPLPLSQLAGQLHAKIWKPLVQEMCYLDLPPFRLDPEEQRAAWNTVKGTLEDKVAAFNVDTKADNLSLVSGTNSYLQGGVCPLESCFAGCMKRYFRESLVEDVVAAYGLEVDMEREHFSDSESDSESDSDTEQNKWVRRCLIDSGLGRISDHRSMQSGNGFDANSLRSKISDFESYVCHEDGILTSTLLRDCSAIYKTTRSFSGMLGHLVNLHHSSAPYVEGLTVELLEFQRQSLQWALEREKTPGGIQSFLWPKLPSVAEPGKELYFSPILDCFRTDKPRLVRGGFIAEEMGLGKTVISLALILENPAPAVPESGSPISALNVVSTPSASNATESQWDSELYGRTSALNKKRGSILSRGTLVVCHVSLVGQWIDEARSKLKDPGLVYPYHGQNRKRNAETLAKNSIVVTTYQTLASDATYHAKKGGDGYCAPCEQVRWWRIICDESHSLREANTKKSTAVMNLVADHKWLVSGTPVNTSFADLKNQMKFIGIEYVDEMFSLFRDTAFFHMKDPGAPSERNINGIDRRKFGHFMFLLRCIMIRHTHKQKYRGTNTTLMSLPPKSERTVEIEFSEVDNVEYSKYDTAARTFYESFKAEHGDTLSKHYLKLTQKLTPLRIAASGGQIPLEDEKIEEDADEEEVDTKKKKKEVRYSDFAFRSKLDVLIKELKRVRDKEPDAKSLVFSQFTSTLKWLQRELPNHGFQFRTLSGDMSMKKRAKALHDFQNDPPTTIFLLSMRAGAVGINLTQANRVFLMEPSFNPALEAQAVGRVHRLGQKRKVEIVRLIMKDSVEARLVKMLKKKYGDSLGMSEHDDEEKKNEDEKEEAENDEEKKPAAKAPTDAAIIGSIHSEKTKILTEEFDLLFGVSGGSSAGMKPDAVASFTPGAAAASNSSTFYL